MLILIRGTILVALTITLQPEFEQRLIEEAANEGLTVEQLATQRLVEADLLWRIRTAVPLSQTRQLHKLLRLSKAGTLTESERVQLLSLLDEREERGARRLQDLMLLSHLRSTPVRMLMEQLGINPVIGP